MYARLSGLLLAAMLLAAGPVSAETLYVSDVLIVSLRDVPQDGYKAVGSLKSNAPVELLGEEGRFYHVKTEAGIEGYVPKQYLSIEEPKTLVIQRLQAQLDRSRKEIAGIKGTLSKEKGRLSEELQAGVGQVKELQGRIASLEQKLAAEERGRQSIQASYDTLLSDSKEVVAIARERDRLKAQLSKAASDVATLEEENTALLRTGVIKWFLAGGGVFLFGWLAGKVSRKKQRGF